MGLCQRPTAESAGFAVVDLETTGVYPSRDRIIEVAVVHLDVSGQVIGEFCTLIDPHRDVGLTHIHGITAADVMGAPTFAAAARAVWQRLSGRVLVAHNASFDVRFLDAEFDRCGARLPPPPVMCTMQLASHYLHNLPARNLKACCKAARVDLPRHHSALDDARAAAQLLARFRAAHRQLPSSWKKAVIEAGQAVWKPTPQGDEIRTVTRAEQTLRRASQRASLAHLLDRLPRGSSGEVDTYLGVLDRVLEDRMVTEHEFVELCALAAELGLTRGAAEHAHRAYLKDLSVAAWQDEVMTDAERADLLAVAQLLGVLADEAVAILEGQPDSSVSPIDRSASALRCGDRVAFTGDMEMSRTEIETLATRAGLRVTRSVSRKTALVVAADPYSQSGKARTARERGVRMATEQVFLYLLNHVRPSEKFASTTATPSGPHSTSDPEDQQ